MTDESAHHISAEGLAALELHLRVPEVVEEASTVAEHHRNDVELKFVQHSRCQVLLRDLAAAPKHDVFAAWRRNRPARYDT